MRSEYSAAAEYLDAAEYSAAAEYLDAAEYSAAAEYSVAAKYSAATEYSAALPNIRQLPNNRQYRYSNIIGSSEACRTNTNIVFVELNRILRIR